MEGNPYAKLLAVFRAAGSADVPPQPVFGVVRSAPTEEQPGRPLVVAVGGIDKGAAALQKNAAVGGFFDGDVLLMLPLADAQRYVILCKVVDV